MTDALNRLSQIRVADPLLIPLGEDAGSAYAELTLDRSEFVAVVGGGPRGEPKRRQRTRPWPVEIHAGPYLIHGYLHAPPTVDAVANLGRRNPMVPLTDAWIEFGAGPKRRRFAAATLIVNRSHIERIERARGEDVELPGLPAAAATGPLVKDFTEQVLGG
jgi:hypothetical protein